jgi:cytochrome c-type biogenesis protein CcmH/NrfG
MLHLLLNETAEGLGALRRSVQLNPRRYRDWEMLATVLMTEERWDEALEALEITLDQNPNSAIAWYNLALCYLFFEEFKLAKNAAETALALDPSLADVAGDWFDLVDVEMVIDEQTSTSGIAAS